MTSGRWQGCGLRMSPAPGLSRTEPLPLPADSWPWLHPRSLACQPWRGRGGGTHDSPGPGFRSMLSIALASP